MLVPDGALFRLPFGVLREDPADEPLALRFATSLAPSMTLWMRWKQEGRGVAARRGALALADPFSSSGDAVSALRALEPWTAALTVDPLPSASEEASFLVRRLGKGGRVLQGADASEGFLKRADLGSFGTIHFAVHAIVVGLTLLGGLIRFRRQSTCGVYRGTLS